jgi:hypothetical protein
VDVCPLVVVGGTEVSAIEQFLLASVLVLGGAVGGLAWALFWLYMKFELLKRLWEEDK